MATTTSDRVKVRATKAAARRTAIGKLKAAPPTPVETPPRPIGPEDGEALCELIDRIQRVSDLLTCAEAAARQIDPDLLERIGLRGGRPYYGDETCELFSMRERAVRVAYWAGISLH